MRPSTIFSITLSGLSLLLRLAAEEILLPLDQFLGNPIPVHRDRTRVRRRHVHGEILGQNVERFARGCRRQPDQDAELASRVDVATHLSAALHGDPLATIEEDVLAHFADGRGNLLADLLASYGGIEKDFAAVDSGVVDQALRQGGGQRLEVRSLGHEVGLAAELDDAGDSVPE